MLTSSRKIAGRALILAALGLAGLVLVPALLGYERYVITTGSMAGSFDPGSIVYARAVPVEELRVGDVITYEPPRHAGVSGPLTHRIVAIEREGQRQLFRTKGDANRARDPWRFELEQPTQARAEFTLPYLGYAFSALDVRVVRAVVIAVPALLIAAFTLMRLGRDVRDTRAAAVHDA